MDNPPQHQNGALLNRHLVHFYSGVDNQRILAAIDKLYRANMDCEQILATNAMSSSDEFASNSIVATGQHMDKGQDAGTALQINAFTPRRNLYLHIGQNLGVSDLSDEVTFAARLPGTDRLPEWVDFSPQGFASIECSPGRQFVDLEIDMISPNGLPQTHDIRLNTFTGEIQPGNNRWLPSIDKQLAAAVGA